LGFGWRPAEYTRTISTYDPVERQVKQQKHAEKQYDFNAMALRPPLGERLPSSGSLLANPLGFTQRVPLRARQRGGKRSPAFAATKAVQVEPFENKLPAGFFSGGPDIIAAARRADYLRVHLSVPVGMSYNRANNAREYSV
jgi:hypothetical protein